MMNLIKITQLVKRRVKDLVSGLLPEFGYVRVTNQGLVVLKKKWWSFNRTIVNVKDLFIDVLPRKLAESCRPKGYGDLYKRLFSNAIYFLLQLRAYKKNMDIVDYIWDKYNLLYREIPTVTTTVEVNVLEDPAYRYLPVLSPMSSYYIPGVTRLLRIMRRKGSVERILEKISKIISKRTYITNVLEEASRFVIYGEKHGIQGLVYKTAA
jgi:hypothetical protein